MYKNTNWLDHVVDADSGEVIQEGTEQSAANFNNMEHGIGDASLALSLMQLAIRNESVLNRIAVVEFACNSDVQIPFSLPDGFTSENSIVLSMSYTLGEKIYMLPAEGYVRIGANSGSCSVPIDVEDTFKARVVLFRYK